MNIEDLQVVSLKAWGSLTIQGLNIFFPHYNSNYVVFNTLLKRRLLFPLFEKGI